MATSIPADERGRALFLYHPNHNGAKRIDVSSNDPEKREQVKEQIANLKRDGWREDRFAVVMFHKQYGQKVVTNEREVAGLKKTGWHDKPIELGSEEVPLFHEKKGFKIAKNEAEAVGHENAGWQRFPCSGPNVHKDAQAMPSYLHPHCADDHRKAMLQGVES